MSVLAFDERAIEVTNKLVAGARVYCEGRLSTNEWTTQDGEKRFGLSVMSWHTRLAQIGRNKPKRERTEASVAAGKTHHSPRSAPAGHLPASDFNDEIGFFKGLIEPVAWQRCEIVNQAEQESLKTILAKWGAP